MSHSRVCLKYVGVTPPLVETNIICLVVGEFNGPTKLLVNYNQRRMRLEVTMTGCCNLVLDGFRDVDVYCPLMSIVPGMMLPIPLLTRPQETVCFFFNGWKPQRKISHGSPIDLPRSSVVLKVIAPCFDKRRTATGDPGDPLFGMAECGRW